MKAHVAQPIDAPSDAVWDLIAKGGDVHRWFAAAITTCELTSDGEGAARHCTMADGAVLEERILEIDPARRRSRYAIDRHPLPARDVVATISVAELPDGRTEVTWGADYTAAPEHEALTRETLEGLYAQGIRSLETYLAKAA